MIAHCLFEQSGTFKNEFIKLGIKSYDYDISNKFKQTDYVVDLFEEIDKAVLHLPSIFTKMKEDDLLFAFFPCIRFENQIIMSFKGNLHGMEHWSDVQKLRYSMDLHDELNKFYKYVTKLCLVAYERNLHLIIENPYSTQHYLTRYFPLEPKLIDFDRSYRGDYFKKPTQYWFINCEPKNNLVLEDIKNDHVKVIDNEPRGISRSLISTVYANRFIREFIL